MSCWPDFHKISSVCSGNIFANPAIFILTEFLFLLKILKVSTNFPAIPRMLKMGSSPTVVIILVTLRT